MPFIGNSGKLDRVFLARLDPQNVEDQGSKQIQNIITGDVEAANLFTSNIAILNNFEPTHNFELGSNLFMDDNPDDVSSIVLDVKKFARFEKLRATSKIAVENENPTHAFDVGDNKFFIDTAPASKNLAVVNGRMRVNSLLDYSVPVADIDAVDAGNFLTTSNLIVNDTAENVIECTGNVLCSKITATDGLSFGSNIELADTAANVLILNGNLVAGNASTANEQRHVIYGNLYVEGNVVVTDVSKSFVQENLAVSNAIIEVGAGQTTAGGDTAIVFHQYNEPNVMAGYVYGGATIEEFAIGRTNNGPSATNMNILPEHEVNVHIYGSLWASNVGLAGNVNPQHNLAVGSNLWVEDTSSNVLYIESNAYAGNVSVGERLSVGSNVQILDSTHADVVRVTGNAAFSNLSSTTAIAVANANPNNETHSLSIGDSVFARSGDANTFLVVGNTVSSNLIVDTGLSVGRAHADEALHVDGSIRIGGKQGEEGSGEQSIKSTGGIVVHANDAGTDDLHNSLVLKAGSGAKSSVEIRGAYTDAAEQVVVVKTLDVEALRVSNQQNVGISNANPSEKLTVNGTVFVKGNSAVMAGEEFTNTKHSARMRTDVSVGETFLESRVASGKGLNIGVASGPTMDTKVTILDTGRVGIGSTDPQALLQTSGGSCFIGAEVSGAGAFNHSSVPLVVTNQETSSQTTVRPALALSRQAPGSDFGSKAQFNIGKYTAGSSSRTRLDVDLSDGAYDAVNCLTLRSDGKTGVGTQVPTARLHVVADGSRNHEGNGLLVFNPTTIGVEDAIVAAQTRQNSGDAFFATSVWDGATNYSGWTFGAEQRTASADINFRVTNNVYSVSNVQDTAFFLSGLNSNCGIGTDVTPAKLTVAGSVRVGDRLQFSGTTASGLDNDDKIFFQEREIGNTGRTELLVYKGNDADTSSDAVDRIRTVSGEHSWQVYDRGTDPSSLGGVSSTEEASIIQNTPVAGLFASKPVMRLTRKRQIFLNTEEVNENQADSEASMYSTGHVQLHPGSKFMTAYFSLMSDVQSQGASPPATAVGDNQFDLHSNFDLLFTHGGSNERLRLKNTGEIGIGTNAPSSKLTIYDATTSDIDLLALRSPSASTTGATTRTGLSVLTDSGWGGYARAFRTRASSGPDPTGLVLGTNAGGTETDVLTITRDARVGVNTSAPAAGVHVYDANALIQSSTSNASLGFQSTSSATANIECGVNGDLYLNPLPTADDAANVVVSGNLDVASNISFGGSIQFGENAGLGIGVASPATLLHVNGGMISNSDHFAAKHYSYSFQLGAASGADGEARDVFLRFKNGSFVAEIKALLRDTSNGNYLSCMTLEVAGGHTNPNTTPTFGIAIGVSRIFGSASNPFPWDHRVVVTPTTLKIVPRDTSASRTYNYDVYVKLHSSVGGALHKIQHDEQSIKDLKTFAY